MPKKTTDQEEMFAQKQIAEIEGAIVKADKKRAEIEAFNTTEKDTLRNLEHKITEALHKHINALDAQEDEKGNKSYIYRRGAYVAVLKSHERLSYEPVADRTEGAS